MSQSITNDSSPQAKIALFRSLFRGRDDVYPRRFVSRKTGKAGYSPACGNEWVPGVCEKPRIKCSDCPNRRFLPVTDEVVRWHLSGQDAHGQDFVMGIYPMLLDETCFFLAVDFLCEKSGAVIELDGAQHLADADAYRRDRRKDALLQQNGYFVLRFLTEDAGKHLDHVLDTIVAALVHRENNRRH
ncbi:MAG: DUF559 domain-containing protein [Verrucomicrobia bacterium]|nr:DUF559 domain-containing protein [Verrucomicrobiota bacterium]